LGSGLVTHSCKTYTPQRNVKDNKYRRITASNVRGLSSKGSELVTEIKPK